MEAMARAASGLTAMVLLALILAPCLCGQAPEADPHACCAPQTGLYLLTADSCACAAVHPRVPDAVGAPAPIALAPAAAGVTPHRLEAPSAQRLAASVAPAFVSPPAPTLRI